MHARVRACVCVIALLSSVLEQCITECCLQFVSALHLSIHCILAAEPDHTSSPSSCLWSCSSCKGYHANKMVKAMVNECIVWAGL